MVAFKHLNELQNVFSRGGNLLEYINRELPQTDRTAAIALSYDLQAGGYTKQVAEYPEFLKLKAEQIANELRCLGVFDSIVEVGCGEATTFIPVMRLVDPDGAIERLAFDISWSRTRYALDNSRKAEANINLFVADLFNIPLADNSVDVVFTSHSLEPNGGREKEALTELARVARKFLFLLEPDFNRASQASKDRMKKQGYISNLQSYAEDLGLKIIIDKQMSLALNPLNPTGLIVIEKLGTDREKCATPTFFKCPITNEGLTRQGEVFFNHEAGLLYPIVQDIPCLLSSNAILATKFGLFPKA